MYLTANNLDLTLSLTPNNWIGSHKAGTISGTGFNDVFYAVSGDRMSGGAGDDHYYVWDANYTITEAAGKGIDTLYNHGYTPVTLAAHVENLVLAGPGAKMGFGNNLNNVITAGTTGAYINGGVGSDVLVGGAGMDTFVVKAGEGSDSVYKFTSGKDLIRLDGFHIGSFKDLMSNAQQQG